LQHQDYGVWEGDGDPEEEYYEEYELNQWYHDETGYLEAAGVGSIDDDE
jgi:hypothetical protein